MHIEKTIILAKTAAIGLLALAAIVLAPGCGLLDALDAQHARARATPNYGHPFEHRSTEAERRAAAYYTPSCALSGFSPGKVKIKPGAIAK